MACSHYANEVGFLDEADELGHALETWSDTAAQHWASVERQGRFLLTGGFANFLIGACFGRNPHANRLCHFGWRRQRRVEILEKSCHFLFGLNVFGTG